ncbi:LuxR family transcriptional regulator [Asticcacaulis sp. YBE204]|uniref:helix-turn-helix transcriptional regulator n=1 Tax=Asticcacaulis sp. YBE204 TaxID=1282363 RepID=UPI0003C3EE0D|nr:LuxR family transcriptional regulator [Asticcacaulis sp. YBE204]ESQ77840.1 hypothetical protein AEYBE204_17070 [Asticcacaulis sp. YBE204]
MLSIYRFEDFVSDTVTAPTEAALFGYLSRAVGQYGYERIIFSIFNDPDIPECSHAYGIHMQALEGWKAFYNEKNYARIDPLVRAVKSGVRIFAWDDLAKFYSLSRAQAHFMGELEDLNLRQGIAVPLAGGRAAIGLSTADREKRHVDLPLLNAICAQFYQAYRDMKTPHCAGRVDIHPLSVKERDVLLWLAAGKTDGEIGQILGISQSTVDGHLRSIFHKLDAPNRVVATVRGLKRGYISL